MPSHTLLFKKALHRFWGSDTNWSVFKFVGITFCFSLTFLKYSWASLMVVNIDQIFVGKKVTRNCLSFALLTISEVSLNPKTGTLRGLKLRIPTPNMTQDLLRLPWVFFFLRDLLVLQFSNHLNVSLSTVFRDHEFLGFWLVVLPYPPVWGRETFPYQHPLLQECSC